MNNEVLERLKEEYGEDDDLIQLYEDWGNTPYLHEIYRRLDEHLSEWVFERELGRWAAEFIREILQEH
mgnify:CR=1 FL=1